MKQYSNIQLSYQCPKTVGELTLCNSDWYCNGCSKVITDFRGMTEQQIIDVIVTNSQIHCGIFDAGSIAVVPQTRWKKYFSAVLLTFGLTTLNHAVFAQQKTHAKKKSISASAHKKQTDTITAIPTMGIIEPLSISEPEFIGGLPKFYDYFKTSLKDIAIDGEHHGTVKFIVNEDGSIDDVQMVQNISIDIDQIIIEVIKKSPRWKPAIQDSKPVKAGITIPVSIGNQ